jgi:long-chain acyl-CoA synthetase
MDNFPWIQQYPQGVRPTLDTHVFNSLTELLESALKEHAARTAFVNMGKSYTYAELDRLSDAFAAYLQQVLGLKKGDAIAIQMPNCLQYPVALFGALKAGMIVVNTNPLYTPREMLHQFNDAGVKAVVIVEMFAQNLQQILPQTQIKHIIITGLGDMLGGIKGLLVNFVVRRVKKMVPAYSLPQAVRFADVLDAGKKMKRQSVQLDSQDVAFLQYTGGTTGVSKGAVLTHGNLVAHTLIVNEWFKPLLQEGFQETIITAIPLYHIFALSVNGIFMTYIGAQNILITNPRDMKAFIKDLAKYPFTLITGVNTLYNGLLNQEAFHKLDFSHLKTTIGGGMAVQKAVAERWQQTTGSPLVEGYGLSETSPVLSVNPLDGRQRIGYIGLPISNTEMAVFDDEGNKLPLGEVGEICARGPQVMKEYWNRPEETAKVMLHGEWFRTGDMGVMDEDGFFRIVDRKKDMINVSGFNVYPNEVEDVISGNAKVLEVAAVGIPDERSTEVVKVFVVKKDASLTADELIAFCRKNLTAYKVPKVVEFREELPKSNVGKILRRMLREETPAS